LIARLLSCGGQESVEGDLEGVEGVFPTVGPAFAAFAGGVETHDREIDAFEGGLLVREVAAGVDGAAET
jgi:hypothetical protein